MADLTEIDALKASMRGALHAAQALGGAGTAVDRIDAEADIAEADLDTLHRLSLANAVAAQALRGLVESMLRRRGRLAAPVDGSGGIED